MPDRPGPDATDHDPLDGPSGDVGDTHAGGADQRADGTDRLLLAEAREALATTDPGQVVIVDDRSGALTLGAVAVALARAPGETPPERTEPDGVVRVHQDWLTSRNALDRAADRRGLADAFTSHGALDAEALRGATLVLLRLPKSLDALTEVAEAVARHAEPEVVLYAAGPVKHLTRSMNEVLADSFGAVHATLGQHKARGLVASEPLPGARVRTPTFPRTSLLTELDLTVVAHGGVFAGARLDLGTRFLLDHLPQMPKDAQDAVDLGCGSGVLAAALARTLPGARVVASDQSAAAVASAAATAAANGLSGAVVPLLDDALSSLPGSSVDLVVCNPPFHAGTRLETDAAHRMFSAAGRVLRPGGELWTVFNSHLRYRGALTRAVGPTTLIGQNPKFIVTRSVRAVHT